MKALALLVVTIIYPNAPSPVVRSFPVETMAICEEMMEDLAATDLQIVSMKCDYIDVAL